MQKQKSLPPQFIGYVIAMIQLPSCNILIGPSNPQFLSITFSRFLPKAADISALLRAPLFGGPALRRRAHVSAWSPS